MVYYGFDYVAQIGTMVIGLLMAAFLFWLWLRLLRPMFERMGMVERVKMAMYDVELEKYCKENKIDYSKIDVCLAACYKRKQGKLNKRLQEIEEGM